MIIGILDIMGSVEEHAAALDRCGVEVRMVKSPEDFDSLDGLIIPGGESTTIGDLLDVYSLKPKTSNLPIWGTCAGAILLAKEVGNRKPRVGLRLMDIAVDRNSYGGQLNSFETELDISFPDDARTKRPFNGVFIRAPKIKKAGKKAKILASYDGFPVMVREGNYLATTFHPELTNDLRVHKYFIKIVSDHK